MSFSRSLTLFPLSISNLACSGSGGGGDGGCGSQLLTFHGYGRSFGLKIQGMSRERSIFKVSAAVPEAYAVGVGEDLPEDYGEWFPKVDPLEWRRAGILLHPSSLSGPYGIGDLGKEAFRFLDWLHDSGCSIWQVLPLVPPGRKANEDGSPYAGQYTDIGQRQQSRIKDPIKLQCNCSCSTTVWMFWNSGQILVITSILGIPMFCSIAAGLKIYKRLAMLLT